MASTLFVACGMSVTEFTMQDVAKHNTPDDLWLVINGKVYDVTDFAEEHPGGADLVEEEAGARMVLGQLVY